MRRHKHVEEHENHERWLISYADFITLMFAFFVVLFAASQADRSKTRAVSEAVESALKDDKFAAKLMSILGGTHVDKLNGNTDIRGLRNKQKTDPVHEKLAELTPSLSKLTKELEKDIKEGRVQVNLEPRGLVISLKEGAFFAQGQASINEERLGSIAKLAAVVKPLPNPVRLEGHTDSVPISNSHFRNNWELSAARSIAVLRLLSERFGVAESRMAIVGYADTIAMGSNNTEEGRTRNRRVDITILNEAAVAREVGSVARSK